MTTAEEPTSGSEPNKSNVDAANEQQLKRTGSSSTVHSGRHLAASSVVFDPTHKRVLLALHKVTRYFQFPGGHPEAGESGADAAIREVQEETGVRAKLWTADRIDIPGGVWQPSPILTVEFPAPANPRWNEPPHLHVDQLYLATADSLAPTTAQPDEIDALLWLPLDELDDPRIRPDVPVIVPIAWGLLTHGHQPRHQLWRGLPGMPADAKSHSGSWPLSPTAGMQVTDDGNQRPSRAAAHAQPSPEEVPAVPDSQPQPKVETSIPHSARLWNYWLGGKDNYAVDRAAGDEIARRFPSIIDLAKADRAFLQRVVQFFVADQGIRQILDIGTGLPTANNTHEVAQSIAPESRIVYVDNDPLVLVHARALLTSHPAGATDYIEADLHDPAEILRQARRTLNFDQPIAITLLGIVHFILDDDEARAVVRQLVDAMPSGSYLTIAHGCNDINRAEADDIVSWWNERGTPKIVYRSSTDIERFFDGLELIEPGVVPCSRWRPGPDDPDIDVNQYCGVGRKPLVRGTA